MNALTKVVRTAALSRAVLSSSGAGAKRCYVKVGDKVNIIFVKDEAPIVIKEDKEYPDWVFKLSEKLPSKVALMDKFGPNGEGVDSMTTEEKKRLKRLLRLAIIKEKNAASQSEA
eukprot:CAMPEP_0184971120 /NCGR_PEP_ID=MMETSP1098-20130426/3410_1 /TAXON_ID=89044 /ORGANISM="Spumella elongata, Strain CCAP 955/1" /LENGTH=114 /DNA_ID=CAMNT_0027493171 /DNA_START=92 /DNA_END=436 /DNA_ORIENTATION=+